MAFESFLARQIGTWLVNKAINLPKEIRDPLPTNATDLDKFLQASGRRICDQWARVAPAARLIPGAPQFDVVCFPYLNNTGQAPTSPAKSVPVSSKDGGQCSGKKYSSYIKFRPSIGYGTPGFSWGSPIESFVPCNTPGFPDLYGPCYLLVKNNTNGTEYFEWRSKLNSSYGANGGVASNTEIAQLLEAWVQICPGEGVDNCGTPDGYTPPTYPPLPTLPPPSTPAPGTQNNNWDIQINNDGTLNFCMNNSCNQIPAPGDPPPAPSENPGSPYGTPVETDPNTKEGGGCVPAGYVLTGIKITIKSQPQSAVNARWGFYKSAGWVRFGPFPTVLTVSPDIVWLADGMFATPPNEACSCYSVKANPGWAFAIQAYAKKKQSQSAL